MNDFPQIIPPRSPSPGSQAEPGEEAAAQDWAGVAIPEAYLSGRIHLKGAAEHWGRDVAQQILEKFPDLPVYTCAAGISPSGVVHFGNFRDVMTSLIVARALQAEGKEVRMVFSWDDYDRLRKVPSGVDPSFARYIGCPLSTVPDPGGRFSSYARRYEQEFESAMQQLGIKLEYRYQTQEYTSGRYDHQILQALAHRQQIAEVLLGFMSEKFKASKAIDAFKYTEEFYPVSVYSRFSGNDNTKVLGFDGDSSITYRCLSTGKEDTVNLRETRIAKLSWKIDWPMRWAAEQVVFEPGGKDHASPGGSYDVASVLSRLVYGRPAPLFLGYEFISLRGLGGKMSSSQGQAVTPAQLLEIYEPELLLWMYASKPPNQVFSLAFDSEVFRQYDEFDRFRARVRQGQGSPWENETSLICMGEAALPGRTALPFRQAVGFGQVVQWDPSRLAAILEEQGIEYDSVSTESRLKRAKAWLETYNSDQKIALQDTQNLSYRGRMGEAAVGFVRALKEKLASGSMSISELETLVYAIPRDPALSREENAVRQRAFFKDVYNLLIGRDTGPRLSTFLWAVDRELVLSLLDV